MIVNDRKDFDNLPTDEKEKFMRKLAAGTKRWRWDGSAWQLQTFTAQLDRLGITIDELPDVPDPPKPDYNPEERRKAQELEEIMQLRKDAYERESDPIYMEYMRGERTEQEWLDAVHAIKDRYPKPE